MAEIYVPRNLINVKSGKRVAMQAVLRNWVQQPGKKEKQPKLIYFVVEGDGDINDKGVFSAPITDKDLVTKILVSANNAGIPDKEVEIRIEKAKRLEILPRHVVVFAGSQVVFTVKTEFNLNVRWEIKDFSRGMGNIDPKDGLYTSPEIIQKKENITIVAIDRNTGKRDEVEITLLPVKLQCHKVASVRAGEEKLQLNAETHNDISGLDNFTCKIVSKPEVGTVSDGGIYIPPERINSQTDVLIEIVSKRDKRQKAKMTVTVKLAICKKCGKGTIINNVCGNPSCGKTSTYVNYLIKTNKIMLK